VYTLAVVTLTLAIASTVLYGLYRLGIYTMQLHEADEIRGRENMANPGPSKRDWTRLLSPQSPESTKGPR
jgi:hypothetical protein